MTREGTVMTVTASAGLDVRTLLADGLHLIGPDWVPGSILDYTQLKTIVINS